MKKKISFILSMILCIIMASNASAGTLSDFVNKSGDKEPVMTENPENGQADSVESKVENGMKTVYVSEKSISVTLPKEYITLVRNDSNLDPRLITNGFSIPKLYEIMESNSVYLYIFDPSFQWDVNFVIFDSTDGAVGIDHFDDEILLREFAMGEYVFEDLGLTVVNKKIKKFDGHKYVFYKAKNNSPENYQCCLSYFTIIDEQTILITFSRYDDIDSDSDEALMDLILDSSNLNKHELQQPEEKSTRDEGTNENYDNAYSSYYTDDAVGISFAIPVGWEQRNLSQKRETIKFKMGPVQSTSDAMIMYANGDMRGVYTPQYWESMGVPSEEGFASLINADYFASYFDVDPTDIEIKMYGGKPFALFKKTMSDSNVTIPYAFAATFHNGYVVIFTLVDIDPEYSGALETVLNSVVFK